MSTRKVSGLQVALAARKASATQMEASTARVLGTGAPENRAARRAKAKAKAAPWRSPRFYARPARLVDGSVGYYADSLQKDDCFRAAIATATQIPIDHVPDLRLQDRLYKGDSLEDINAESWQRIAQWADRRELALVFHEKAYQAIDRKRWVGVCVVRPQPENPNPFTDHCLVMSYDAIIFDPAASANAPRGMRLRSWHPADISYGISFDHKQESDG